VDRFPQHPHWVANPPPGAAVRAPRRRRLPYLGPPSYGSPPRWGFPALAWRWPTSVPGTRTRIPATVDQVRVFARNATATLWIVAAAALLGAAGEIWRYVLLLRSRDRALPRGLVDGSDALVVTGALLAITFAFVAAAFTVWWLVLARSVADETTGHEPARPHWQVLLCLLIPGVNLVVAGSALAELEHAVLRRPSEQRPRPSRTVLWWWILWVVSGLLFTATVVWRFRSGVQAEADGVVLNAVTYLAAAAVAIMTIRVVRGLTTLLAPIDPARVRLMRVIKITGAPDPPLRPGRPAGSVR
jgi:Domain of unknown function (DUF4328)